MNLKAYFIFVWLLGLGLVVGWVWNIVKIIHMPDILTGIGIARCIGVFLAPIGAVLGFF